jgi:transcriptional regulator with XRE-family HTH domain
MGKSRKSEPDPSDLESIIKKIVEESGMSQKAIGLASGVAPAQLSRFMRGERSLTLATASALAKSLGFTIVKT